MSKSLRFYGLLREDGQVRKIEMDADTANSVSARFLAMKADLLPHNVAKKKYRPLAAAADDDKESVFSAPYDLPKHLSDLAEKGDVPAALSKKEVVGGHVRAIIALPHSTKEPAYLFQAVSGRSIIRPGGALFMTKDTFHERADPGLIIGSRVNAVWQSGELLFRKESDARRVLDFSAIFEPATNKQLEAFAGHQKLTCDKNWLKNEASDFYRRRIAAILAGGVLEKFSVTQLQDAAAKVKFTLPLDTDQNGQRRIKIGDNKKELKRVLQFLNEDIYRAPITEEIFCAAGKTEFDA